MTLKYGDRFVDKITERLCWFGKELTKQEVIALKDKASLWKMAKGIYPELIEEYGRLNPDRVVYCVIIREGNAIYPCVYRNKTDLWTIDEYKALVRHDDRPVRMSFLYE